MKEVHWTEIDPELREKALVSADYDVRDGGLVRGWGFTPPGGGGHWGMTNAQAAWDVAFAHMCGYGLVYLHKKGGIYKSFGVAKLASDGSDAVLYEHLAPHEKAIWARNADEFFEEGRFVRVVR